MEDDGSGDGEKACDMLAVVLYIKYEGQYEKKRWKRYHGA